MEKYRTPFLSENLDTVLSIKLVDNPGNLQQVNTSQPAIPLTQSLLLYLVEHPVPIPGLLHRRRSITQYYQHGTAERITFDAIALHGAFLDPTAVCERRRGNKLYLRIWDLRHNPCGRRSGRCRATASKDESYEEGV